MTNPTGLQSEGKEKELVKETGWKQIPECGYVIKGKDEEIYCTYKYNSERLLLSKAISGYSDDKNHENIIKQCSVKFCPFKLYLGV